MLNEEPEDIIKNVSVLQALRAASAKESERERALPSSKVRKPKPPKQDLDGAADSPGPSPSVASGSASRLKGTSTARSGSVASVREEKVAVKVEEGSDAAKGPSAERAGKFVIDAEVAYKQAKVREDGSQWIVCKILSITEVGNKKRYVHSRPCGVHLPSLEMHSFWSSSTGCLSLLKPLILRLPISTYSPTHCSLSSPHHPLLLTTTFCPSIPPNSPN